jgi:hypothetical protein
MPFLTLRKTRMNVNPKHEALSIPMVLLLFVVVVVVDRTLKHIASYSET